MTTEAITQQEQVYRVLDALGTKRVRKGLKAFAPHHIHRNQGNWTRCFLGQCLRPWWWRMNDTMPMPWIIPLWIMVLLNMERLFGDSYTMSGDKGVVVYLFDRQPAELERYIRDWLSLQQ